MRCSRRSEVSVAASIVSVLAITILSASCSDGATDLQQAKPFFTSIDVGHFFTCATTTAGPTLCWGTNRFNELGRGVTADSAPVPAAVSASATFAQISAGIDHSCGLERGGGVFCWGAPSTALGTGSPTCGVLSVTCGRVPTRVASTVTFSTISVGADHTCGLDTGGFAWCWGENPEGQLGSPGASQPTPAPVAGQRRFISIASGARHTCAVSDTNDAFCWGYGGAGQLGAGAFLSSAVPIAVKGGLKFASIFAPPDGDSTCGLTGDGTTYCWGIPYNASSLKEATAVPTAVVGGVRFAQLSLAASHACGIAVSGGAYCWGDNFLFTIGEVSRDVPTPVAPALTLKSIATSFSHTCGVDSTGEVYCWGDASEGELGGGADRPTKTPVRVIRPG